MKILFGRLLLGVLARLPLPAIGLLSRMTAIPLRVLMRRKQAIASANVALAFPEMTRRQRDRLVRRNTASLLRTALECGPIWHRDRAWLDSRIVEVRGRSHLDRARASGRGVLLLGGHLGNWELTILYGSLRLPIHFLYKPPGSARVDELLAARRSRFGARMVPTGGAAMRRVIRALREGGAVGLLFDQLPRGGAYVVAPFFGQPAATMRLPHRIIRATGCDVVMGHCLRSPDGRGWRVAIEPVPGADDPDPAAAATAMNRALEHAIRAAPEQYLWHYRRFQQIGPDLSAPAAPGPAA